MSRTLILLTWNEIEAVRALQHTIPREVADEILVIDGGSADGTIDFLQQQGFNVVVQDKPGRGYAMRLGVEQAKGDTFVFFSLDGNEDAADIEQLFVALEHEADVVIASRMMTGAFNEEDVSWWRPRKWVNQIFGLFANLYWNRGPFITDTINGFRGFTKDAWAKLAIDANDFTIEYQSSIRAMKLGLKIVEIPTHEGQRLGGESKARSFETGLAFLKRLAIEMNLKTFGVLAGITALSFLYPGYLVFRGDQRLYLPWINRNLHPELYAADPVASVDHFGFSLFDELSVFMVQTLNLDLYVWLTLFTIVSRLALFYALYRLAHYFTDNYGFSLLVPLLFMTNLVVFGSAMDTMIYEAHHRTLSLGLSLLFLVWWLDKRWRISAVSLLGALLLNPLTVPPFLLFAIIDYVWPNRTADA